MRLSELLRRQPEKGRYQPGAAAYECCAACGAQTRVLRSTPIGERQYYLEGAGQLCERCGRENVQEEYAAMLRGHVYTLPVCEKP
ncbi:MAG: hypothetical protein IJ357_06615 [Oscillospiraceae bacterium]|nr:hypothetical protein [Oscillospiraceae bacterium]